MADASLDSQIEGLFTRLDAQLKNSQFKKALKVVDESEPEIFIAKLTRTA